MRRLGNEQRDVVAVRSRSRAATTGIVEFGPLRFRCALGRSGITALKREGDGATPRGSFAIAGVYFNPQRTRRPLTRLPVWPITQASGWCDAAGDRNYNRPVVLPYAARTECLWRDDGLYDLVVVIDYNRCPRVQGQGSAIFLHVARPGFAPTEGCIAMRRADLKVLLGAMSPRSRLSIAL